MNIEECKSILIKQIKNPKSAFNLLMREDKPNGRTYRERRAFRCTEFTMGFTILSLDDEGHFQILFEEGEERLALYMGATMDISDSNRVSLDTYAIEHVNTSPHSLLCSLKLVKLKVKNYEFSDTHPDGSWFTLAKLAYADGTFPHEGFYERCLAARTTKNVVYLAHHFTSAQLNEISKAKWGFNLDDKIRHNFMGAWLMAKESSRASQLMEALEVLREVDLKA